ncbi:MAG TPA: phosphatase PAP2 family protein [Gemmatimonadaceae bacterium]|nr:phosphatase PAP2 family protein [Gemmatimonadaceae bacterium]
MRVRAVIVLLGSLLSTPYLADAQRDSASRSTDRLKWIVPVGVAASAALDPEAREWALQSQTRSLDRLARPVNRLGTTQVLAPAMAITYVGAVLTDHQSLAVETLNTAAGFVAADLVESVLKPVVGRERPYAEGNSHRFRPFTANGDWHSFPSAHVAHITSIAAAISAQAHSTRISALTDVLVTLVGWDRVYEDQHWTSDVTATVVLSSLISNATVRWLESRQR